MVLSGGTISQIDDTGNINGYTHDVLHNRDDTIDGYGHLSAGDFVNDAGGTIDGNSSSGSLVIDGSANLTNNGLIEASDDTGTGDSGSLIIDDVVTNNAQIAAIETGIVTIAGSVNGGTIHSSNAGSIVISGQVNGAALDLSSAEASLVISGIVKGGSLQTENGAAITAAGGALDGAGAQVYSSAAIFIETDQSLTIKGTLDETGTITLGGTGQQAALLAGSATTTLTGGGQILMADGGANVIDATIRNDVLVDVDDTIIGNGALGTGNLVLDNETTIGATGGSPLFVELSTGAASVNTGTMEAAGGGELQFVRGLLTNNGVISAGANSTVQFAKAMQLSNYSAGVLTGGSWSVAAGATMIFGEGAITTDAATITLTGADSVFESGSGYTFASLEQTLTTIAAGGTLQLPSRAYTTTNAITLDGTLSLGLSASVFTSGLITASATSALYGFFGTVASSLNDAGVVNVQSNGILTFTGASEAFSGALSGYGSLAFTNGAHASLNAGASVGVKSVSLSGAGTTLSINENLTYNGAVTEAAGAILTIASGDTLTLGGVSTLSGTVSGAGGLGLDGGTLTLNGKNTFTGAITFDAHAVSKLVLSAHALPTNAIAGLASGDTIDLTGLAYAAGDHIVFNLNASHSGGTLSIENTAGTVLESLRIAGDYNAAHFSLASDSAGGMLITTIGAGARAPDDFNGDGASDLLWANAVSGQIEDWLIANGALSKSHVLGALLPSSGQSVVGEGDFNGDGTTDLLIQNAKTGALTEWDLANGVRGATVAITVPKAYAGWQVADVGDFNGDGVGDILLQDKTTGSVADLLMHGGKVVSSNLLGPSPGADWTVAASGDFNGDGAADLLWRNNTTGQLEDWTLTDGKYLGDDDMVAGSAGLTFVGTGDFFGDGTTDLLLQSDTGALSIALPTQSGPHAITWYTSNFATVPTGFGVIGTGDFNGDGVADLMIQNKTTGQVEVGLVSAGDIAKWTPVGTISNSAGWNLSA